MSDYRVPTHQIDWAALIAPEHWQKYKCVLDRAMREQVPFALGGGLSVGVYTGKGRYTKIWTCISSRTPGLGHPSCVGLRHAGLLRYEAV
jgi:hypothetical protein